MDNTESAAFGSAARPGYRLCSSPATTIILNSIVHYCLNYYPTQRSVIWLSGYFFQFCFIYLHIYLFFNLPSYYRSWKNSLNPEKRKRCRPRVVSLCSWTHYIRGQWAARSFGPEVRYAHALWIFVENQSRTKTYNQRLMLALEHCCIIVFFICLFCVLLCF